MKNTFQIIATLATLTASLLTLGWSSSSVANLSIAPGIGSVPSSGTRLVPPAGATTYAIKARSSALLPDSGTATGLRKELARPASAYATATVLVRPTVSIIASPGTITRGGSSTLSWSSSNATSVSISPDIGSVPASGTLVIYPTSTTTYEIAARDSEGTVATDEVTVTVSTGEPTGLLVDDQAAVRVNYPRPTVRLSVSPGTDPDRSSAMLTWSSSNVSNLAISPGIGSVPASGALPISPTRTTTYTITATGPPGSPYGTIVDSVTVTVRPGDLPDH